MRHARTSDAPAAMAPPVAAPVAAEPWTWPEAPGLPPQVRDDGPWSTAGPVVSLSTLLTPADVPVPSVAAAPEVVQPTILPAADRPPRRGRGARTSGGPSPEQRYGPPKAPVPVPAAVPVPVEAVPAGHRGAAGSSLLRGPVASLAAALLGVAFWGALVSFTGSSLAYFAIVVGLLVGAATRLLGGPSSDVNVFFAVVWSMVGACAGLLAGAVLVQMSRLGVGAAEAIAGPRWNDIVTGVASQPLNGAFVLGAAAVAVVLVRR